MPLIYLLAGEHSGDVLGARLMAALRAARPDLDFAGIGGPRMAALGFSSLFPMHELAVMGLVEIVPRLWRLRRRMAETVADIAARRPAIVVTIDSPGFALRLLRRIAPLGVTRVHYVAPQVWAWRESRVRRFPGLWDRLLCLLPFEPDYFARFGLDARFVGHPVLESGADQGNGARFRAAHGIAADAPLVILMPGSRPSEAGRLLPVYGQTVALLAARFPNLVPVVPAAGTVAQAVARAAADWPIKPLVVSEIAGKHDAFAAASAALTKSGTSTLELALAAVPMAVTYRVNALTAMIARRLIRVPHVAMVNLLAGREVVPELLQENCSPERLAATVAGLITTPALAAAQREAFRAVLATLRPPAGLPSEAAAAAVLESLEQA
ncbi:MAG: lipid-A-disaccharide synthase [Acidibrevibacterium sp.]|jgi:lipid-A-disaccharide synthase|uniref:lipid-A-disaccharide synthase n=1 Tax=Acidibrevibacterium fodinaquatile TaxID=1969806 RepID=UPI0023A8EEF5|nr:lipid-A-disaccharide synthase [Acidibrevibacterium fodinaquatile]MCA7120829.1 lipid-A-disaccharide synthase [Acidibrevibacterium fodinaquatile]